LSAADSEWDDDAIADFEIFDFGAEFNHPPMFRVQEYHRFLHGRLIAVEEMEIGSTDSAGGNLDYGIARMLISGIERRRERRLCHANTVRALSFSSETACTTTGPCRLSATG
jgi:hypothetical protein